MPSVRTAYELTAFSAEVFCRHSFGQRYVPSLLGSFLFCLLSTSLLCTTGLATASPMLDIYLVAFLVLVLFHLGRMLLARTAPVHSYSSGESWPVWQHLHIKPAIVQILLEPGIHVAAGLLIFHADILLSVWLQLAGLCLFVKELTGQWQRRNRVLDALDARAEGEWMNAAIRQHRASRTTGDQAVNPVVTALQMQRPPNSLAQIIRNLDPALRQLISPPGQNVSTRPPAAQPQSRPGQRRYHAGPLGTAPRITSKRPRQKI